jgi:hypothetical protein
MLSVRARLVVTGLASLVGLAPAACRPVMLNLRYVPQEQLPPPPAAWKQVALAGVESATAPDTPLTTIAATSPDGTYRYRLMPDPPTALYQGLLRRLGSGGQRTLKLTVKDVKWVAADKGIGVSATFILAKDESATKAITLRHSITALGFEPDEPDERDEVYERAIEDLIDRLVQDEAALAFIGGTPAPPTEAKARDSALSEPSKWGIGPVMPLSPAAASGGIDAAGASASELRSSGRIVWGRHDHELGFVASGSLGDTKSVAAGFNAVIGLPFFELRLDTVAGASIPSTGNAAFLWSMDVVPLFGYRWVAHDDDGYVDYPGVALLGGPWFTQTLLVGGAGDATLFTSLSQILGTVQVDVPLNRHFGFTAGYAAGGVFGAAVTFTNNHTDAVAIYQPVQFPTADLWIVVGASRVSLGLAFQALSNPDNVFKNPTINFTWRSAEGRGRAAHDTSLVAGGMELLGEHENQATPSDLF